MRVYILTPISLCFYPWRSLRLCLIVLRLPLLGLVPVDVVFEMGLRRIEALERRSMPST